MTSYRALHVPISTLKCPHAQSHMVFPEDPYQFTDFLLESSVFYKTSDISLSPTFLQIMGRSVK